MHGVRDAKSGMRRVDSGSAHNQLRIDKLKSQIGLLKQKVDEAREKAAQVRDFDLQYPLQIRLSMRSNKSSPCQRSFTSPAQPSPTNTINIRYSQYFEETIPSRFRPLRNVPDSLLLLTRTKPKRTLASEYIALEVGKFKCLRGILAGEGQAGGRPLERRVGEEEGHQQVSFSADK